MNRLYHLLQLLLVLSTFIFVCCTEAVDTSVEDVELSAKVDERIELLSIVFRLAGNNEYNSDIYEKYTTTIEEHFLPFYDHPVVQLAQEVAANHYVGYDAVMAMAVHLEQPPVLQPIQPFSNGLPENRWTQEKAHRFVEELQAFYQDADCESFFRSQQDRYIAVEERFKHLLSKVDLPWFAIYYGKAPDARFQIRLGLANGGGNYGPKVVAPDGKEDLYAIIGTREIDSTGLPVYKEDDVLPIIIHEFNHSFANPLIYKNEAQLESAGQVIFKPVAEQMKAMAYPSWETMMIEALVRVIVIRYFDQHNASKLELEAMIDEEKAKGFFWMDQLNSLLKDYEENRDVYPNLDSFMPRIIEFYNVLAPNIESVHLN